MTPASRDNKTALAYRMIRNQIARGDWQPGDRFSTFGLARRFGIGRTTINDAVRLLEKRGFVRILPNVGFEVRLLEDREIREYLEVRLEIEKVLCRHLAARGDAGALEESREILHVAHASARDQNPEAAMQALEEFYANLPRVLSFSYVHALLSEANDMEILLLWRMLRTDPAVFEELLTLRLAMIGCLLEEDAGGAIRWVTEMHARMWDRAVPQGDRKEEDRDA